MYKQMFLDSCMVALLLFLTSIVYPLTVHGAEDCLLRVGKIVITEAQVQLELQKKIPMQVGFHGGIKPEKMEQLKKEAREAVVVRAYKAQYALDNEIPVEREGFEKKWAEIKDKNPKLSAAMQELVKEELYRDLLAQKAEEKAVGQQSLVSDSEVKAFYDKNSTQYMQPKIYKASHIFVKVSPEDSQDEKDKKKVRAEKLSARAKAGEDFYNLAYYESDDRSRYVGGSLGSFHAGQTVKEFDDALGKMKVGEISAPVMTLYGYHIIRLDEVHAPKQLTLEEASPLIRQKLSGQKRKEAYDRWMSLLKENYPIRDCEAK